MYCIRCGKQITEGSLCFYCASGGTQNQSQNKPADAASMPDNSLETIYKNVVPPVTAVSEQERQRINKLRSRSTLWIWLTSVALFLSFFPFAGFVGLVLSAVSLIGACRMRRQMLTPESLNPKSCTTAIVLSIIFFAFTICNFAFMTLGFGFALVFSEGYAELLNNIFGGF